MIPPNLRQDWLRNTGLLLLLFVALFCFLSWTLFRVVLGDEPPVLGGVEPVPNEFITPDQRIDSPENVPSSEQDIPEPNEPERVEAEGVGDGFGTPFESEAPRFAPQEQELASAFNVERSDDLGVSFVMRENWRRAVVELEEGESPERADTDLVFEAPDGSSRFAISAWDAGERVPFELWVLSVAGGMRSIDGQYPINALVGGAPALIVGDPETPTSPVRYAAFLDRGTHYIRIAWSANGPNADPYDFARALVTLTWDDALDAGAAADMIPAFDFPRGIYYPSESLFGTP